MTSLITAGSRLRVFFTGLFTSLILKLLCASWRINTSGLSELDARLTVEERLIAVFWHGKYYALLPMLRHRDTCVFTSVSSRGAVIAEILRRFGYTGVQLPDHGRDRSLDIMRSVLSQHHAAAIAVDGPMGPFHVVHRGAVQLASELGYGIVPLSTAASRKVVLNERWDRFEMPRLFSRVQLVVGQPVYIPPNLNDSALAHWINTVQQALLDVDKQAVDLLDKQQNHAN